MNCIFIRILRQLRHDKRSLGLIFLAPLLILSLIFLLLGDSSYIPVIAGKDLPAPLVNAFTSSDTPIVSLSPDVDIDTYLKEGNADAVLTYDSGGLHIRLLENVNVKASLISKAVSKALFSMNPSASMELSFVYGKADASMFDSLAYVLLGTLSFFFVFLFSGVSFIRERTTQTLERLMITPIKRYEVILGYTLAFGLLAAVQSVIIILFSHFVLGITFAGPVFYAIVTMILLAFTAVSLGAFFSIFANNEFQLLQFIPIVIVPQIFFSGIIPLDTIPFGLGRLCYIMPIYYGCKGLNDIQLKGAGLSQIAGYLLILLMYTIVFAFINTMALKKYRRL
jgi:ABC-2 type transport system permease protein